MTLFVDPRQPQTRCYLCGALILLGEDGARLNVDQARDLRMHVGDRVCMHCWTTRILIRPDGSPFMVTGTC